MVDRALVGSRGLRPFADGREERRRGDQVQAQGRRHEREDTLRCANGRSRVLRLYLGDEGVVPSEARRLERRPLPIEVRSVGGIELLVLAGDRVDHLLDVHRGIPAMRVPVRRHPDERADIEDVTPRNGVRIDEPLGPGVVADAVLDHEVRRRNRSRVFGRRLIVVRIRVGVVDDARHGHAVAAELGSDASPDVLGRHGARSAVGPGGADAGTAREGDDERADRHGHRTPDCR